MIVKGVLEIGMQEYRNLGKDRASKLAEEELYAGMQDEIFESIHITSKENPLLNTMTFEGEVAVLPVEDYLALLEGIVGCKGSFYSGALSFQKKI